MNFYNHAFYFFSLEDVENLLNDFNDMFRQIIKVLTIVKLIIVNLLQLRC